MRKFTLTVSALTLFSVLLTTVRSNSVQVAAPKFSSAYTDLKTECKDAFKEKDVNQGTDMPLRCKGFGAYYVYIYYSAWASQITVQMKGNDDVSIPLAMQQLNYDQEKGRKVEWRMADNKPFAVILRISNYKEDAGASGDNPFDEKYKTGEALIIKGLKGYEHIDFSINAKEPNANTKAREMADTNYAKK